MLAIAAPLSGLVAFPHRWGRIDTPFYWLVRRLAPGYSGPDSPRDCGGNPYGPFARLETLSDLASDVFALSVVLCAIGLVALAMTIPAIAQNRPTPQLTLRALSMTTLSVFAWAALWLKYL